MNKKKLLILGSDVGSLDVVREAHRMGLYVIVSDLMETSPTREEADEVWGISTTDIDTLANKCIEENVSGILTGSSDFNITQSRFVCKKAGLPLYCEGDEAWDIANNKGKFKKICEEVGAPTARRFHLTDELCREDLDQIEYPVVVKPVDMSGNRGMSYCYKEEDVIKAYKKARSVSSNPDIICEKMLHGSEYVVNYVVANGEASLLYFGRELHQEGEAANLYSMITTSANQLKVWLEEADDKVKKAFKKAGFNDGIAWVEVMLDKDGHFYIIEPAWRFSSETSYALYQNVNGFNSLRFLIETAIGIKHTSKDLPKSLDCAYKDSVGSYHLFTKKGGVISKVTGIKEIESMENVDLDLPKREGGKIVPGANMGLIRAYCKSMEEMVEVYKKVNSVFSVLDENGENMFVRFTGYDQMLDDFNAGLSQFSE